MKKYLIFIFILLLSLLVACKKNENDIIIDDETPFVAFEYESNHVFDLYNDNLLSYIIYRGKYSDNGLLQSLTFYSHILKNNITNREYQYFQVNYGNSKNDYKYYHIFELQEDRQTRNYIQNFLPFNNINNEILKYFDVMVRYSYNDSNDELIYKEIKYRENVIEFNIDNFNNVNSCEDIIVSLEKVSDENYKIGFRFDEEKYVNGHFDVQAFVNYNDYIYPFFGLYNYGISASSYYTYGEEEIESEFSPSVIYWVVNYYNEEGNNSCYYYQYNI